MTLGQVRDRFPRVTLRLPSHQGFRSIEFIVDTGFDGELALPRALLQELDAAYAGDHPMMLADGSLRTQATYRIFLEWDDARRLTEVIEMEGNPLLGVELLSENLLQAEMTDGGLVEISSL